MAETLFKGGNHAISIGGVTWVRAQDFRVSSRRELEEVYQLGNEEAVGVDEGTATHTGAVTWFPINVQTENALVGVASTTAAVSMANMQDMTAIALQGASNTKGITGARLASLEYSVQAQGRWQATMNLRGTAFDADGASVTPDTPSGAAAYRSKHVMVQFETTGVTLTRIRSATIRLNLTVDEAYELTNADPFDVELMAPQIMFTCEWYSNYESGTAGAHSHRPLPTADADQDIEVQISPTQTWDAAGNIVYVLKNMVWASQDHNVRVRQRGFYRAEYRSEQDATYRGFTCNVVT
jgi:hypothetical protein